ncbi:MAG TPA: phage/plasmid primase, P4 family [Pseudobdellovibrionaceae bacterium]|jgi:P4 family phage/plasmid primase-like protien
MDISFNPHIINKPEHFPSEHAHKFEPMDLSLDQVIEKVTQGQALCVQFNQTRKKENFISAGYVCLDFDGKMSLEAARNHPFIQNHAGFIYTTASHGKEGKGDCFRAFLPLSEPITSIQEYEALLESLRDIFPDLDEKCLDGTHLFYGNTEAEIIRFNQEIDRLTLSVLISGAITAILKSQDPIGEGERNASLASIGGSLRSVGFEKEEITEWLLKVNEQRCTPPLPEREVKNIAKSVARYAADDEKKKPSANAIAEKIIAATTIKTNQFGNPYEYQEGIWKPLTDAKLVSMALQAESKADSNRNRRNEMVSYIKAATFHGEIHWRQIQSWHIPLRNGVFDLVDKSLLDHRPEYYLETVLPHDYVPDAKAPRWEAALQEWLADEPAKIQALQMFFGYVLMSHAKYKKALLGYGESNTGKSQVAKVLEALVGSHNMCSISLNKMGNVRNIAPIKGKMLNLVTELPEFHQLAEGGFKQLVSTEDPIMIDPKYLQPEMYVPFCKHVVFTNTLPQIRDLSDAVFNRLLIIEFNRVISEDRQDKSLFEKLKEEMPGIVQWAIDGAIMLHEAKGIFIEPESSKELLDEYRRKQNPVCEWAEQHLQYRDGAITTFEALWSDFRAYYKGKDVNRDRFSKLLKKAGFETERNRVEGITTTFIPNYTVANPPY